MFPKTRNALADALKMLSKDMIKKYYETISSLLGPDKRSLFPCLGTFPISSLNLNSSKLSKSVTVIIIESIFISQLFGELDMFVCEIDWKYMRYYQ